MNLGMHNNPGHGAERSETIPLRKRGRFWTHEWASDQDYLIVRDVFDNDCYAMNRVAPYRKHEVVVDVGAHIGTFSVKAHERNPDARIIACEVCPENIPPLEANVGDFAEIYQGAVTYERDVVLMNSVFPGCVSTGGTIVTSDGRLSEEERAANPEFVSRYHADRRLVETCSIEDVIKRFGVDAIDILKLDCEGSEFSILENTTSLDRITMIVGEHHDWTRFDALCKRRFAGRGWHLTVLRGGQQGIFWLNRIENLERNGIILA